MKHLIGIDPSADTFTAFRYSDGAPEGPAQFFDSDAEGIAAFIAWLTQAGCTPSTSLICIENTGVYSEILLYSLHAASWPIALVAPLAVHRAMGKGRGKSDALDSARIAEYGHRFLDTLQRWQPHEAVVEQIKVLLSTREQLVEQKTALKNTRSSLRRKYIQTPTANHSLDHLIDQIKGQIRALEAEIKRLIEAHPTMAQVVGLIVTTPGVGLLLSAHLLVLTNGFREPVTYRRLAAHLGMVPLPHESGTSVRRLPRARGYGPAMMRKLLHLAARSLVTHRQEFKQYYARKRAQGKPAKVALNNVANDLLRILCSMIKNNKPYIEGYVSVNPRLLST